MPTSHDVSLAPFTTLGVGGSARTFVTATSLEELLATVTRVDEQRAKLLVLGGGSNLVVSDEGVDGTVLKVATRGIDVVARGSREVEVTVAAGEVWDDFVAFAVGQGLSGVECLAGIPGLVGAVPMQNVGAYGQDVGETIARVTAWDRDANELVTIARDACGFSYRSSVFRGRDRHVITSVTFSFERDERSQPLRYAELTRALGLDPFARAPLDRVRQTVIDLRRKKGMVVDPSDRDTASAGSFFTNPVVDDATLARVRERARIRLAEGEIMPTFPERDGRTKLSAGWLIEKAGFRKGHRVGNAAVSSKHALALTNRGGASAQEIVALARAVRDGVHAAFGIVLENEPVFVGLTL